MPTNERDSSLWGYRVVADAGRNLPTPCGTEEANEGTASGGNTWAKRKFNAATPMGDDDNTGGRE